MKKAILFILILQSLVGIQAQTGTPIYSITDGKISVDASKWVEPFDTTIDISKNSYTRRGTETFKINATSCTVEIGAVNDWEEIDETNFNTIAIYRNKQEPFTVKQLDCWTYTYGGDSTFDYSNVTDNRYFITLASSETCKALAFIGWPYGGELSLLTIIAVTEDDAKIVFNKHVVIRDISDNGSQKNIKIQTLLEEYDSCGKLCVAPTYATMIAKDGVLYWKE